MTKLKIKNQKPKTQTKYEKLFIFNMCFLFLIFGLWFSSCGGSGSDDSTTVQPSDRTTNDYSKVGSIKAIVSGSKSFNPNISHGQIVKYKVTITGDDIAEPVVAEFDGTATSGVVEGVPVGKNRQIKVEAINPNEKKIREGETANLEIEADTVTDTEVKMESVPIFANLADGNTIPNTRLIAKLFSDPQNPVTVEDEYNGTTLPLFDVNASNTQVYPDISSGMASFAPPLLASGEHKLTVKNVATGRLSIVVVKVTDGTKIKAAPFFSASSNMPGRFGQAVVGY